VAKKAKAGKKKTQTRPQPEPAQLNAVRRLLEQQDFKGAIPRIRALMQRFPDSGGLHGALVLALEHAEGPTSAGLAAFAWAERRPNSLTAQEALLHFATALRHVMLADRTADRVRELGGETPGFPLDPALKDALRASPDGTSASAADLVRFDIGRLHLAGQDFAGALRWLKDLDLSPALNNRAVALFHLGRIAEALDAYMSNWRRDPENLFALGEAVRLRLYQGDDAGARGLCTPLAAASARRADDAHPQLQALLLLNQDQSAWDAFQRATQAEWFDLDADQGGAMLRHFGACAACRLGKSADARRLWQEASAMNGDLKLARINLDQLDRDGKASSFPVLLELAQAVPVAWTRSLGADPERAVEKLDTLTASNAYLQALYTGGDEGVRSLVGILLKHRAERSDADAARLLRELARLPLGTKDERFGFLSFLKTQGLLGPDEHVGYWDGESLRETKMISTEVYRDASESGLPADLETLLNEAIHLYHDGQLDEAASRLADLLRRAPDHPVALGNLAAVRSLQGREQEAERLLRQAIEKNPDYLFARCNLAKTLILKGKIEEAEQLLTGLVERERLHIQEVFTLWGSLAMLHAARGEHEEAQSLLASLESMAQDEDEKRRLAQAQRLVDRADPRKGFKQALKNLLARKRKPRKPGS